MADHQVFRVSDDGRSFLVQATKPTMNFSDHQNVNQIPQGTIYTLQAINSSLDLSNVPKTEVATMADTLTLDFKNSLMDAAKEAGIAQVVLDFADEHLRLEDDEEADEDESDEDVDNDESSNGERDIDDEELKEEEEKNGDEAEEGAEEEEGPIKWLELPTQAVIQGRIDILLICPQTSIRMDHFRDSNGDSLLHTAVRSGNLEMIHLILQHVDINVKGYYGTALRAAASLDICPDEKWIILKILVDAGSYLGLTTHTIDTPLHAYVNNITDKITEGVVPEQDEIWKKSIDLLSDDGRLINECDWFKKTALHCVCELFPPTGYCDYEDSLFKVIDYLLERGSDLSVTDNLRHSLLHTAALSQNVKLVQHLLAHNCPIDMVSNLKLTAAYALCVGAVWSNPEDCHEILFPILDQVIKSGCDLNIPSINQSTVLHHSAATSSAEVVQFLLDNGSDINQQDFLSRSPLHMTARNNDPRVVGILLKAGCTVDARNKYGYTALHYAGLYGNDSIAKALIEAGADPSAEGNKKEQPLHFAAERGEGEIIKDLVEAGADVNCVDDVGATPLHYAGFDGMPDQTEALLKYGASMHIVDKFHQTPLTMALKMGQFKVAEMLTVDAKKLKCGDLYSFPNRPPILQECMTEYSDRIIGELLQIGTAPLIAMSL